MIHQECIEILKKIKDQLKWFSSADKALSYAIQHLSKEGKVDDFQKWIDSCPDNVPSIEEVRKITAKILSLQPDAKEEVSVDKIETELIAYFTDTHGEILPEEKIDFEHIAQALKDKFLITRK